MAIDVGTVVWLNSGQGPYTVIGINADQTAVCSQGNPGGLQTLPIVALSESNPSPKLEANTQELRDSIKAATAATAAATAKSS